MANSTLVATAGTISIAFGVPNGDSGSVAQAALSALTSQVSSGSLNITAYNPSSTVQGSTVPVTTSATVAQTVTAPGGGTSTIAATQAVTVTTAVYVASIPAATVAATGSGTVTTTVPGVRRQCGSH